MLELSHTATEQLLRGQREVLAQLARGASLRETLSSIAHYAEVCTPDMQASILWYEAATGKLRRGGHARLPDAFADTVDGLMPGPVAGSCGTAAYLKKRTVSFDVQLDPLWAAFREFAAVHHIRSAWSTPLISPSDGSLLGVFGMYYPDTREPSEEDLALVDHFVNLAAIAIERNRRDEALRESERRRHQGLLALTAGMAHELNTPLGVARTASELLAEDMGGVGAESLALVQRNLERGMALVRTFQHAVLEQGDQEVTRVELGALVAETVGALSEVVSARRLDVQVTHEDGPVTVKAAPARLGQVLQNLVTNAAFHAYGDAGGKLGITVRKAVAQEGKVELVVIDEGRGMSDEEAARCTDAFYSTTRTKPGAGLGLFIARHVIEAELGGSMLLETRPGAGVRWTLLLPVATGGV